MSDCPISLDTFPSSVLAHIFSFLLDAAPLPDGLTLANKLFRHITYTHPLIVNRFSVRVDPSFNFNSNQSLQIGMGKSEHEHGKKNIVIKNIQAFVSSSFPLQLIRIYHFPESCAWDVAQPIFGKIHTTVRYMSWNSPTFMQLLPTNTPGREEQDQAKETILKFENCLVFSLLAKHQPSSSIDITHSFPNLVYLQVSIENLDYIRKVEELLSQCTATLRILILEFNVLVNRQYQLSEDLSLTLPKNLEVVRLSFLREIQRLTINFDLCKDYLKYLVIGQNTWNYVKQMFSNTKSIPKKLKYLVFDDPNMYELDWTVLDYLRTTNKMDYLYAPCYANYAQDISSTCVGRFPLLKDAKAVLETVEARKILRELAKQSRRNWLWGLFWNEELPHIAVE